jgi:hypothetical protein
MVNKFFENIAQLKYLERAATKQNNTHDAIQEMLAITQNRTV